MNDITFGVDWAAAQDLEKAANAEIEFAKNHNDKVKNGKKMTPAQHRDAIHKEIADAVVNADLLEVQNLLSNNPTVSLQEGDHRLIHTALLKHFDKQIAQALSQRRLYLSAYDMKKELERYPNIALLQHLIEKSLVKSPDTMESNLEDLRDQSLGSFDPKISLARRDLLRSVRLEIEKSYPNAITQANNRYIEGCFLRYQSDLTPDDICSLNKIEPVQWEQLFSNYFTDVYERSSLPTAQNVQRIVSFTSDFSNARQGWNAAVKILSARNRAFTTTIETLWDESVSYEHSVLKKILYKFGHSTYNPRVPYASEPCGSRLTSVQCALLGLPERSQLPWNKAFPQNFEMVKEIHGAKNPLQTFEAYTPASFVHLLIETSAPASMALLESEEGRARHFEALSDPQVLVGWCQNATPSTIAAVVKHCPQWKSWVDAHGNNLGHYLTAVRYESSKTFAQLINRINHEWVLQANNLGHTVKDVFKKNGATVEALNVLDNENIKRSLKSAGITKTKRNSNAPTLKRKM